MWEFETNITTEAAPERVWAICDSGTFIGTMIRRRLFRAALRTILYPRRNRMWNAI